MLLSRTLQNIVSVIDVMGRAVERHGGGARGGISMAKRALNVLRALGPKGFISRLRGAQRQLSPVQVPTGFTFPPPHALADVELRVGIMVHLFYADLAEEFASLFRDMPIDYVLLVSVVDEQEEALAQKAFAGLPRNTMLSIKRVENRGRDIAPLFVNFRDEIHTLDVVAHVHTKKSLYTGSEQTSWRRYLTQSLFGNHARIAWILGMFAAEPKLGIIYPESYLGVPAWGHTWLGNVEAARQLGARLSIRIEPDRYLDFPAGSMFWARVEALRPILKLGLSTEDFPIERGQTDGTLQHAIERMLVLATRQQGMVAGILPQDGKHSLSSEAGRNWEGCFQRDIATQLRVAAIDADIVSLDIFDTLVLRPFLFPSGARSYLASLVDTQLGVGSFASLRERSEQRARQLFGADPTLDAIYRAMSELGGLSEALAQSIKQLELGTEARTLKARSSVVDSIARLKTSGMSLVAVSDMYLTSADLQNVLPADVTQLLARWYVSCETRWRKDDGGAWDALPVEEGVQPSRWLHVGDNEHADIQLPQARDFLTPLHILRPSALLDLVPSLRSLRPADGTATPWQDQLMLGLLANHLANLADRSPESFGQQFRLPAPYDLGYLVLGPILVDYTAWLIRLAQSRGIDQILFLAREGYLLHKSFLLMRAASPAVAKLRGDYLLASRRSTGMAALLQFSDLYSIAGSTFTGKLIDFVQARMGDEAAATVHRTLGNEQVSREIFLPEMRQELQDILAPCATELLEIAREEREAYLQHWKQFVSGEHLLLADIGYAGTIQKHLARLTGRQLSGAYFGVNTRKPEEPQATLAVDARFFDSRAADDLPPQPILRHHLLLETLMTSGDGQLSHFTRIDAASIAPQFTEHDASTSGLGVIMDAQRGALDYVAQVCDLMQEKSIELSFDRSLVQTPLDCVGTGKWVCDPSWLGQLSLTDRYTGRGTVSQ